MDFIIIVFVIIVYIVSIVGARAHIKHLFLTEFPSLKPTATDVLIVFIPLLNTGFFIVGLMRKIKPVDTSRFFGIK